MITVVANLKGGCGKSTVTFNLAVWLSMTGQSVISFDLDPQATLSEVVDVRREMGVEPALTVYRPDVDPEPLIKQKDGGMVLMDISATNRWTMRYAIRNAARIIVPVPPSQADVWSTQRFLDIVAETLAGKKQPEIYMFINRADTHPGLKESDETQEALESLYGVTVLKERLGQRTAFRRSFSEGRAVFELSRRSKAAEEFLQLTDRLFPELSKSFAIPSAKKIGKADQ
ncbi:MAG: AAA family ATPase [Magnetococcales bacterium]|nr:AAA family ATPase [Magnetococcales bacterium]